MGHLTRQIDIANELKKLNYNIIFLSKNYPEGILLLEESQFEIIKLSTEYQTINDSIQEINEVLNSYNKIFDFIILDLFEDFDNQEYLNNLKLFCSKLFVLSDEPKQFYIQVNAVFAFSENQESFNYNNLRTKYYTGLKYFPLHSKFQEVPKKKVNKKVSKVLITFGGSDPNNFSGKLVSSLKQLDLNVIYTLILGAGYSKENYHDIMREKFDNLIIKTNIKNMNEYLIETDICICSAGNTVIEALVCGVPCIVLPQTKLESERAKALEKKQLIINKGLEFTTKRLITVINNLLSDYSLRKKLSKNAQNYLDGKGIKRIVNIIS
ncbi:MAG: glycosyltransferase [Promethearchaeota archaeon]